MPPSDPQERQDAESQWLEDGGFYTCLICETSFAKPVKHACHPCEDLQAEQQASAPIERPV